MKTSRDPCGCRWQTDARERWLELCPKHKAEHDALHARAQVERQVSLADFNAPRKDTKQ